MGQDHGGKGKLYVAVATDGYAGYFPFDHEGGGNLEKVKFNGLRTFVNLFYKNFSQ